MDKQYEYLEQLIRIAERSAKDEKLECTNEIQNVEKASDKFFRLTEMACAGKEELRKRSELTKRSEPWLYTETIDPGWSWSLVWDGTSDCAFSCQDVFQSFVTDDGSCVSENTIQKNGAITTSCGIASYVVYKLGDSKK